MAGRVLGMCVRYIGHFTVIGMIVVQGIGRCSLGFVGATGFVLDSSLPPGGGSETFCCHSAGMLNACGTSRETREG